MDKILLEGERLILKPLSLNDLVYIINNDKIETPIELEALYDFVKIAISKKIEKMQKVSENVH